MYLFFYLEGGRGGCEGSCTNTYIAEVLWHTRVRVEMLYAPLTACARFAEPQHIAV